MSFRGDARGVAPLIGVLILFGFAVIAFAGYQAFAVPQQSASVEFDHNERVENDMVDLRNAVLEAKTSGDDTFASVTLGAQFQPRIVAVNPPNPSGTIQTTDSKDVAVKEAGTGDNILEDFEGFEQNRFIEYRPQYSAYESAGTIRYENTVVYHEFESANVPLSSQRLLRNDTISLITVQTEFQENSRRTVSVEPIPGLVQTEEVEDPVLEIPTELSEDDWESLLADEFDGDFDESDVEVDETTGVLNLTLSGVYELEYSAIGLDRAPDGPDSDGDDPSDIDPAAPGDVRLVGAQWDNADDAVELTFENAEDDNNFTEGRINFYDGNQVPDEVEEVNVVEGEDNPRGESWPLQGNFNDLEPEIELEGNNRRTTIELDFDDNVNVNQDFFVITLTLETGEQATYFVAGNFAPEFFEVDDLQPGDTTVTEGETETFSATVENTEDVEGTQDIELVVDAEDNDFEEGVEVLDSTDLTLDGGEQETVEFEDTEIDLDPDEYDYKIRSVSDESETATLTVEESEDPFFDVTITGTNEPVVEGDPLEVTAEIENTGDEEDTQDIELLNFTVDVVDTEEGLTLGAGDSETVTLVWNTVEGDAGTDDVTVESDDDADTEEVTIEEASTTLTLTAENDPIDPGDSNEITVEVTDEDGDPIADEDVELTVSEGDGEFSNNEQTVTVETDGDGEATATYESVEDDSGSTIEIDGELVDDGDVTDTVSFDVNQVLDDFEVGDVEIDQGEALTIDITNAVDQAGGDFEGQVDVTVDTEELDGFEDETTVEDVTFEDGEATDVEVLSESETEDLEQQTTELTAESGDASDTFEVTVNVPEANSVSGVDGTIDQSNIGGSDQRSALEFDISADTEVTLVDFSVITQNDADNVSFDDDESTFDGEELNGGVEFEDDIEVELREFDPRLHIQNDDFVDPDSEHADIVVTLEFQDGSELELGVSAEER